MEDLNLCMYFCDCANSPTATDITDLKKADLYPI